MAHKLTTQELQRWNAWKIVAETIKARVAKDVADATGLSDPDYGVLSRLMEVGKGQMRQQALCDSMNWSKSRMSHHLTRMEERDLVARKTTEPSAGTMVVCTPAGKLLLEEARPVHAQAVREHLLERMSKEELAVLDRVFNRLLS